jgi:hypothetical protein
MYSSISQCYILLLAIKKLAGGKGIILEEKTIKWLPGMYPYHLED